MSNVIHPSLDQLMSLEQIPSELEGLREGLQEIFQDLFVKDLIFSNTLQGESAFYSLTITSYTALGINIPIEEDFKLVFNPGQIGTTEIPIYFDYSWLILKYVDDFSIENFDNAAKSLLEIFMQLANTTPVLVLEQAILQFYDNPEDLELFVSQFNTQYSEGVTFNYDSNYSLADNAEDVISEINKLDYSIINVIFEMLLDVNGEGIDNLKILFQNYTDDINKSVQDAIKLNFNLAIENVSLGLQFPRKWLQPVYTGIQPVNDLELDDILPEPYHSILRYNAGALSYSTQGGFRFDQLDTFQLDRSMIGNTGLIAEFSGLKVDLSREDNIPEATADGRPENFKGVFASFISITLPKKWFNNVDETTLELFGANFLVGTGGVSGTVGLQAVGGGTPPSNTYLSTQIGNWEVGFNSFDITFKQNVIIESNILGRLTIPKLKDSQGNDAQIDLRGHLNEEGDFNLTASEPEGIPFTLFDFVTFNFLTLELGRQDDEFYIGTSCQIWFNNPIMTKLIGDQKIEIPRLRVYDDGSIEIVGGNGFIPTNISLDLGPVEIAVTGIHYGSTQLEHNGVMRRYNYWGFDGAISLDPLGIDARGEGIKYYYTTDNDEHNGNGHDFLRIQTIEIDLVIPGTASPEDALAIINGSLSIPEPGESPEYKGQVSVQIPKARISGGAAMRLQPRYPAFILESGFDIGSPIPLGATGLGFYGFGGLLGYRYVADKQAVGLTSEDSWYDYFTVPQRGVNIDKFRVPEETEDSPNPFSIGAGTVMATIFDDGYLFSTRLMAILSLPSVFILDGRANVLGKRLKMFDPNEPPFFAFVAIGDNSLEFGFGADYEIPKDNGWIIDLYAEAQAGFFFNNSSAWYVNFGTRDNPITATLFKQLLNLRAQSFLMLSASGMEAGARLDFELRKRFGPARVHIYAYLEVGGFVSFERPQIGGYIAAGGGIEIDIWIVSVSISLDALFSAEAPKPFLIYAEFEIRVCVSLFIGKICKRFTVKLKWELNKTVDRTPIPPLPFQNSLTKADRTKDLVKGIHMLTNEPFELTYLGMGNAPSNPNSISAIIPLDTYVEFKTEKGLLPGAVTGTNKPLGGYTFPPENHVDLMPPQRVVRGNELRQVKHKYSIEDIEIKAWSGSQWRDYHPFEAVVPEENRPDVSGLRVGYWQLKGRQYETARLLATTPFTYMEAGQPGWVIPELFGITPSTLFCSEEIRKNTCIDFLNKTLGEQYLPHVFNQHHEINGVYFKQLDVDGLTIVDGQIIPEDYFYFEITDIENVFNFAKSLSFQNESSVEILLPDASVEVSLKLSTPTNGITISYYKSVINDTSSVVEHELVSSVYKTQAELNNVVIYNDPDEPIIKIILQPDAVNSLQVREIFEEIEELFNDTYRTLEGEVEISEPYDAQRYNELVTELEDLGIDISTDNCVKDEVICEIHERLQKLYDDCYASVETSAEVDANVDCFGTFESIIKDEIIVPYGLGNHPIVVQYDNHVSKLIEINNGIGHHEQILRFRDLKEYSLQLLQLIFDFGNCDCGGSGTINEICDLAQALQDLIDDCFPNPVSTVQELVDERKCLLEFQSLIDEFNQNNPDFDIINELGSLYIDLEEKLDDLITLLNNYPGGVSDTFIIDLYYEYRECAIEVIEFLVDFGSCNQTSVTNLTSIHQVCWLTVEDHEYNVTIPGSDAIEEEYQDMVAALSRVAQPIWRPNTSYYIKFRLKDEVDNGESNPGLYDYFYGFKTVGPLGHYHKNAQVDYVPSGASTDEYPLTSLGSYIDYNRSYPNANGSLLKSKPLFYGHEEAIISLFFTKPYVYHLLNKWNEYLGLPDLEGELTLAIKDPVTGVTIPYPLPVDYDEESVPTVTQPNTWENDDDPRIPPHIQTIINMIEDGEIPCEIDLGKPITPNSQNLIARLTNLKPRKLYTVLIGNAFEVSMDNVVNEPIHEFVFQTSRYPDFRSQVNSYLLQEEGVIETKQAVYELSQGFTSAAIDKAYDIINDPTSQIGDFPLETNYQDLFDRVVEGVLEISPLDPPEHTEFNKVIDTNTGNIIGLWIRNPEPFNDPKVPLETIIQEKMIETTSESGETITAYRILYNKDYSQAFIMRPNKNITVQRMHFKFRYFTWNGSDYDIATTQITGITINE